MTDNESPVPNRRSSRALNDSAIKEPAGVKPQDEHPTALETDRGRNSGQINNESQFTTPLTIAESGTLLNKDSKTKLITQAAKPESKELIAIVERDHDENSVHKKNKVIIENTHNRGAAGQTDQKDEKAYETHMPILFANQSGQKSLDEKKVAEFQNGSKVQISFADISNQGLDLEGKQNGNQQSKFHDLLKAVHNFKEQPGKTRPKSTYKISEERSKQSSLQPRPIDTPISTAFGRNPNMSKSSSRVKSSSRPTKTDKSPPRKVMKFYEKGDPKQIVDLDSTAMFKNGVLGASHSKGSQERYKKRGHLRQMEDLLAQMNNGEQSTPVRRISPANGSLPQDQQRKDLFFKRYSRPQNTPSKIDHEAIKYHAATVMVAQLEADKQREDKRRRFVVLP